MIADLQSVEQDPQVRDRWLFRPVIAVLVAVFCLTFLCGLPGIVSFVLILSSLVGYPIGAGALLVTAGVFAVKKRFRKATSVVAAIALPILLARPIFWGTVFLHLGLTAGFGLGQLGSTSPHKGDQFAVYDWSVGLVGGPNTFLIFDMTDEIALPLERHTRPIASEDGFGEDCAGKVRHLLGHYYVCTV